METISDTDVFMDDGDEMIPMSTYYQMMHISEIEYLINNLEVDRWIDAFIDSRVENHKENEEQIQQKDIDESVRFIPCPKRSHNDCQNNTFINSETENITKKTGNKYSNRILMETNQRKMITIQGMYTPDTCPYDMILG